MASKNDFSQVIDILNDYSVEIQEGITNEAQRIAKEGKDKLKDNSPKRTGKYAKGWTVTTKKGFGWIKCVVHNKTSYRLTHLLERPHLTRNGGYTKPKVHIKPVEESIIREFENNVKNIIQNGG